jgi:hypothetical protein
MPSAFSVRSKASCCALAGENDTDKMPHINHIANQSRSIEKTCDLKIVWLDSKSEWYSYVGSFPHSRREQWPRRHARSIVPFGGQIKGLKHRAARGDAFISHFARG